MDNSSCRLITLKIVLKVILKFGANIRILATKSGAKIEILAPKSCPKIADILGPILQFWLHKGDVIEGFFSANECSGFWRQDLSLHILALQHIWTSWERKGTFMSLRYSFSETQKS